MNDNAVFVIYLVALVLIGYTILKATSILTVSKNGTRFTQWTLLISNVCFIMLVISKLLELKGVEVYKAEEARALFILVMALVGFIFYSRGH